MQMPVGSGIRFGAGVPGVGQSAPRPAPQATQAAAQLGSQVKLSSADALGALGRLLLDPVDGLFASFEGLGPDRGFAAGFMLCIGFGLFIAIAVAVTVHGVQDFASNLQGMNLSDLGSMMDSSGIKGPLAMPMTLLTPLISGPKGVTFLGFMKVWFFSLIAPFTMFLASLLLGKVLSAAGSIGTYFYTVGASLSPLGLALVVCSFLGIGNAEIMILLLLVAQCYLILILYSGLTRLCGLSAKAGAPAVPFVLVLSVWLSKVVIVAIVSHM
ncbi:MAG: hypothetical protein ACP5VF_10170 [Acidobacteriota bacterium]